MHGTVTMSSADAIDLCMYLQISRRHARGCMWGMKQQVNAVQYCQSISDAPFSTKSYPSLHDAD